VIAAERDAILRRLDRISELGSQLYRLELLADDVGRLRGHLASIVDDFESTYSAHLVERIACDVDTFDSWARPTAADRYRQLVAEGIDDDEAVEQALAEVDRESDSLRGRLGARPRRTTI
jgi:hypothetical protein